jgi:hypothetical protein
MNVIANHLQLVKNRILQAELNSHRPEGSVTLVAVSKTRPISDILAAVAAGQHHFAENYLQEALPKITTTHAYDITWHFIGAIQSNKAATIATHFDWVQSIDRLNIATLMSKARSANKPPLNICIQINIDSVASKAGVSLNELPDLVYAISKLPNLNLRGLMTIPAFSTSIDVQRQSFALCRQTFLSLQKDWPFLDTLSMGMSNDLESAIAECSTMVRIGTAIFGPRVPDPKYRPLTCKSNKTEGRLDNGKKHE